MTAKWRFLENEWLVVVVAACIGTGYLLFGFLPQRRTLTENTHQLSLRKMMAEQAVLTTPILTATSQQVEKTQNYIAEWLKSSPGEGDLPSLFGRIHSLAKDGGVNITRFTPEEVGRLARIRRISVRLTCNAQFPQIYQFLSKIEQLPYHITIEKLLLEANGDNREVVQAEIALVIFAGNSDNSDQGKPSG